jgi:hypothetical protein
MFFGLAQEGLEHWLGPVAAYTLKGDSFVVDNPRCQVPELGTHGCGRFETIGPFKMAFRTDGLLRHPQHFIGGVLHGVIGMTLHARTRIQRAERFSVGAFLE